MLYLGIDTSNYTTSAAVVSDDGTLVADSRLPVKVASGGRGIRQSDAVFAHVKNLPDVMAGVGDIISSLGAVGVSYAPRAVEGSYM
ncbi:MAG: O-sialoglycoprotein endopeptidase, partial [Clostridia bacterium]|nr:O-sialoglycoprotein endopeptidase [Clostridia bacterium]